jgi:predicted permease
LLERLKSVPGVVAAAETSTLPPFGGLHGDVEVSGKSHEEKWYSFLQLCSEDYFAVLRIPLLEGRMFTDGEVSAKRPVAVINRTFQRRYFGKDNPIGQKIKMNHGEDFPNEVTDTWFEVIGIVADARNRGLREPIDPEAWVPYTVTGSAMRGILVRTTNSPATMIKAVAKEIWATDPSVAMAEPDALDTFLDLFTFAQPRFGLWIVGIFAGIGLALVTIGVYSVVAYSTARRTHEIGLRMALGAAASDVLKMVLWQGLRFLAAGVAAGLATSLALSRIIAAQLWGVSAYDSLTLAAVVALLMTIGALACWVPARRATRTNPLAALRCE